MKKRIYVCSPYRPISEDKNIRKIEKERNEMLARLGCKMVEEAGAVPVAPHLIFPQFLDDEIPRERELGVMLGNEIMPICDGLWVFTDDVISDGMLDEIQEAAILELPIRMFDSKGNENASIQALARILKEEFEEATSDDSSDDFDDYDEDEEDFDDEDSEDEEDDIPEDEAVDILLGALLATLESKKGRSDYKSAESEESQKTKARNDPSHRIQEIRITRIGGKE